MKLLFELFCPILYIQIKFIQYFYDADDIVNGRKLEFFGTLREKPS